VPSLGVWMNGQKVGEWAALAGRGSTFRYDESWAASPRSRALSLSLPITSNLELRGPAVEYYFDNLLPDSTEIRRHIRDRFRTTSLEPFDLLAAIGRDCAGAVQLLPLDQEPAGWDRVQAQPLSERQIEDVLRAVPTSRSLGHDEDDGFRISIAGTQEKTALLGMAGRWFEPRGATPTTHIFKLPLGLVGGFRGDFSDSVENEWLCGQILRELGLLVAESSIARFGEQKVLIVKRFDRRWQGTDEQEVQRKRFKPARGVWIARLPQEDFCQALGHPPSRKYEADGGPSMADALTLLIGSERAGTDQRTLVLAQLAFWLLAATDGHAKNFSLAHRVGGAYMLTPLYDVLSAWPIIGHGRNQLPLEKAKLAMAVHGKRAHYRLREIQPRHWKVLAGGVPVASLWEHMVAMVESAAAAIDRVEAKLPKSFPDRVFTTIRAGVRTQMQRFLVGAA
jgi:serine/threonine-protein kinase HipA